jgi:hypothetical protein
MTSLISMWAVIVSAIFSVVLGFIWYGPLFGKKWMALSGLKMPEGNPGMGMMVKPIILSIIGSALMSMVLSSSIAFHNAYYGTSGMGTALAFAFVLWLGFIVPPALNLKGWEGKSWTLFWINTGYWLVFLFVSASIIVGMM